jgi:hypothetical protein
MGIKSASYIVIAVLNSHHSFFFSGKNNAAALHMMPKSKFGNDGVIWCNLISKDAMMYSNYRTSRGSEVTNSYSERCIHIAFNSELLLSTSFPIQNLLFHLKTANF